MEPALSEADYVLALKGNQSTLHDEVKIFLEGAQAGDFEGGHCDFLETHQSGHGRIERRRYWITEDIGWLTHYGAWEGLRCAGMAESTREIQGRSTTERRFYIASIRADAKTFARAVRGHWSIENTLHWSLDVNFAEDQCRVRTGYADQNPGILPHISINILNGERTRKRGMKGKQKNAAWDQSCLLTLLRI